MMLPPGKSSLTFKGKLSMFTLPADFVVILEDEGQTYFNHAHAAGTETIMYPVSITHAIYLTQAIII